MYVGGKDGRLFALASDGRALWVYHTGGAIYSSPAVGPDGHIYVGSSDGIIYALGQDGAQLWRFKTKGPGTLATGIVFASPTLGVDGTVYVAGLYDPNLYALRPLDGSVKWVCRFPPEAGNPMSGGWPFASPVVGPNGTIYQTLLYDSHLYAIHPETGTILWSVDLDSPTLPGLDKEVKPNGSGWSEPVVGHDGMIYVSCDDPYLRAVAPNGTIKWVTKLGDVGGFTLTVGSGGLIYAASDDGYIYEVDSMGHLAVRFEFGGWPAFPVIAADGWLIAADSKDYSSLDPGAKNAVWAISSEGISVNRAKPPVR